jgi:hypothetical protein
MEKRQRLFARVRPLAEQLQHETDGGVPDQRRLSRFGRVCLA